MLPAFRAARMSSPAAISAAARVATAARHLSTSSTPKVQRMTVFGAGLMGSGIVQVAAQAGIRVTMVDTSEKALENGLSIIAKSLPRVAKKQSPDDIEGFVSRAKSFIETTTDREKAIEGSDLIVEAIIENLKLKQDLFAFLDKKASPECIFASNTSSLLVQDIMSTCSEERQKRFGGLHFFNPVPVMKLVEVIRTPKTSDETYDALLELTKRMGKVSVKAKDVPGFIVNRLLVPYKLEAVRMLERGDATAEDIDTAMKLGAGYPMGPFELFDYVGIDTTQFISEGWVEYAKRGLLPMDLIKPSPLMTKMVHEDKTLGRKTGKGFFDYSSEKK